MAIQFALFFCDLDHLFFGGADYFFYSNFQTVLQTFVAPVRSPLLSTWSVVVEICPHGYLLMASVEGVARTSHFVGRRGRCFAEQLFEALHSAFYTDSADGLDCRGLHRLPICLQRIRRLLDPLFAASRSDTLGIA
jgi:hypothetical protein